MITCFDIGGSAIKSVAATADGQIGKLHRVPTPTQDFASFTAAMQSLIGAGGASRGVAISIAGVIDPADGRIKCANIPCIDGRALAADLSKAFDLPVWIINDADSFALAEAQAGAGRGHANVFGLILGTGVGGGLVIAGQLVGGPGGFAGEWGHGPVVSNPRFACGCGQSGCLDTVGGARGLERLHRSLHGRSLDSRDIIAAWQAGDEHAERTVACWTDLLSGPLAMLVNTVGASILPVGGGLANSAPLIARLDQAVRAQILRKTDAPIIVQGQSGAEPGLIGAAWLGLEKLEARMPDAITLEVCVDNVHGLAAALKGGADRIELCGALETGGLTPSAGLLRAASSSPVPVVAMIRPRGGDFCFDEAETRLMLDEIDAVAAAGLQGVVLGATLPDGQLDRHILERLVRRAAGHGLRCTLHRAIDLCPDLAQATRLAIGLGFERILTSGGARSATEGLDGLQHCFDAAAGRIAIMPGAGIHADNVGLLRARLPLTDVHASCSEPLPPPASPLVAGFGFDTGKRRQTSSTKVAALKAKLQG